MKSLCNVAHFNVDSAQFERGSYCMTSEHFANDAPQLPSDRSFGFLFVVVFVATAGYTFYKGFSVVLTSALVVVAALLATLSALAPKLLAPSNRAWFALGLLLGKIVNPVVMGAIFFVCITPIAIATRLAGRDVLKLRKRKVATHWVERYPIGPNADSFKNQF